MSSAARSKNQRLSRPVETAVADGNPRKDIHNDLKTASQTRLFHSSHRPGDRYNVNPFQRQRSTLATRISCPKNGEHLIDPNHPRDAPKLAASVHAWLATADKDAISGKSPKQALEKWLRENAPKYGLSDEDGNPNADGIEQCAKVANWKQKGGAPKTPNG